MSAEMPLSPSHLAVMLASLAACEHVDAARPQQPTSPEPELAAPGPTSPKTAEPAESAEPATEPAIARPAPAPIPVDEQLLDRRCMSRAGCRWKNEKPRPRVVKKAKTESAP